MSRCISTLLIGLPRIRALPAVGKISPISSLMVVDLAAPFRTLKPSTSPVPTCMFSPSSDVFFLRCRNPKGYSLVNFSISIAEPGLPTSFTSGTRRITAMLRGPVDQPVLANVQVTRPRTAAPVVFFPTRYVMLEFVESRKRPLPQRHHCFKNLLLVRPQRFQLPVVVMNNPHRA